MIQITISLRSVFLAVLLAAGVFAGSDVAHSAPSAAPLNDVDVLVFSNPGANGGRDIRTEDGGNTGGIRIYTGGSLTNPPTTAALQFFGSGHTVFSGQAFIDSASHPNAAILFRTAASGGVAERMRITANGRVGIGTSNPQSALQVVGNAIQFPTISGAPPAAGECSNITHAGRVVVRTDGATNLYICVNTTAPAPGPGGSAEAEASMSWVGVSS